VSQLPNIAILLFCHSGLDPWFDRPFDRLTVLSEVEGLTTLSKVEGESRICLSALPDASECPPTPA